MPRTTHVPRALYRLRALCAALTLAACAASPAPSQPAQSGYIRLAQPPSPSRAPIGPPAPPRANPDPDGDGVASADDRCPDAPEDCDHFEDTDGCPEPDNDRDQIADVCDRCPLEPETYDGSGDEDGCPNLRPVVIESARIVIIQYVRFRRGSTAIDPASFPVIDAVANVMRSYPDIRRVGIVGHASTDERNLQRLTEARAVAVRDALVQRGIDASRFETHGAGDARPLVDNRTAAGRERNRRAEFVLIDMRTQPARQWNGHEYVEVPGSAQPPAPTPAPVQVPRYGTGLRCPGSATVPPAPLPPPGGCPITP